MPTAYGGGDMSLSPFLICLVPICLNIYYTTCLLKFQQEVLCGRKQISLWNQAPSNVSPGSQIPDYSSTEPVFAEPTDTPPLTLIETVSRLQSGPEISNRHFIIKSRKGGHSSFLLAGNNIFYILKLFTVHMVSRPLSRSKGLIPLPVSAPHMGILRQPARRAFDLKWSLKVSSVKGKPIWTHTPGRDKDTRWDQGWIWTVSPTV